jgi:hypothetical protein
MQQEHGLPLLHKHLVRYRPSYDHPSIQVCFVRHDIIHRNGKPGEQLRLRTEEVYKAILAIETFITAIAKRIKMI